MAKIGAEYVDPLAGEDSSVVRVARLVFYRAIECVAPEVPCSLRVAEKERGSVHDYFHDRGSSKIIYDHVTYCSTTTCPRSSVG